MRKFVLAGALALAVGALGAGSASAITLAHEGMRAATDAINPVDNVACWRRSWHGWGWYPCRRVAVPRYYGYGPYYRPYNYAWPRYAYPRVYRYGYWARRPHRWY